MKFCKLIVYYTFSFFQLELNTQDVNHILLQTYTRLTLRNRCCNKEGQRSLGSQAVLEFHSNRNLISTLSGHVLFYFSLIR